MTDLNKLEKLLEAATPGPWARDDWGYTIYPPNPDNLRVQNIAHLYDGEYIENPECAADAELIVAAVNALPTLIARLRELEEGVRKIAETPRETFYGPTDHGIFCRNIARNLLATKGGV